MVKFRYNLENILNIKYKMEEQAKTAYGNANQKLLLEQDKLSELNNKKAFYQEQLKKLMSSNLNILKIKKTKDGIEIMKLYIKQQEAVVKKAEQQLEIARTRLNAAMLERKTHEKLKENAYINFMKEYEAEQRKEIDELVSFKYNSPADNPEEI
ncbi:MAG: hypothetical protein K0R92_59 [Lachnospiraceae bacterium]|jgi:flagellar FliJ protein|nr:hypothetical protein [Lachnospiraceae bacterium]